MEEVQLSEVPGDNGALEYLENHVSDDAFALCFVYDSSFSNTSKLRGLMEKLFDIFQLEAKDRNRLVLVSDELNNNAVEHGSRGIGENKTRIEIKRQTGKIYVNIEVIDCGNGRAEDMEKLKSEKDERGFEKHHGIRGRGLFLITERIADRLYFENADGGGLLVGIEKTL